jgi:hypothetical protein
MSSSQIRTETIQTTVSALNREFAGRIGSVDYNETKSTHIHRRQRAFVWKPEMQLSLLDSILKGYPIPPIYCAQSIMPNSSGVHVMRREVMEGGNRITTIRRILNGDVRELTEDERRIVDSHSITLVIMHDLTGTQTRELFRRLNKSVKVSSGQLYAMSEDDSPLVREALALLNDADYPLRTQITEYFSDTQNKDGAAKKNLESAVALVSGVLHGPFYITRSFDRQEEKVEDQTPISRQHVVNVLGQVFDVFRRANMIRAITNYNTKKAQWAVDKYLGYILYDVLMNPDSIPTIQQKWADYLGKVRNEELNAEEALKNPVSERSGITAHRFCRMSMKVQVYVETGRIMSKSELEVVFHPDQPDDECESESDSDTEDDSGL